MSLSPTRIANISRRCSPKAPCQYAPWPKGRPRATTLLELDRGKTRTDVATTLAVTLVTVAAWRDKYRTSGLACLQDAPRSGRPIRIDGTQRATITALA